MTTTKPLSEQSPIEIDTALYALYREQLDLGRKLRDEIDHIHRVSGSERNYGRGIPTWSQSLGDALNAVAAIAGDPSVIGYRLNEAKKAISDYLAAKEAVQANLDAQVDLNTEYNRRPWTRAFLVTDGHVHSSRGCSTCFPTTEFTWLVDLADHDEAEIVRLAGERACTVCYPTAPTLRDFEKASPLFTEEEAERAKARDQRAVEKAERQAKKIAAGLTEDGSEFVCSWREENGRQWDGATRTYVDGPVEHTERFKTEKAAVQWVVQQRAWGQEGPRTAEKRPAFVAIYQAVATKHGKTITEVITEVDAKVVAKRKRDERGY